MLDVARVFDINTFISLRHKHSCFRNFFSLSFRKNFCKEISSCSNSKFSILVVILDPRASYKVVHYVYHMNQRTTFQLMSSIHCVEANKRRRQMFELKQKSEQPIDWNVKRRHNKDSWNNLPVINFCQFINRITRVYEISMYLAR